MIQSRSRINLHEILRAKRYDNAIVCTYVYEPAFFEEYCLEKFKCFLDNGNLTVITDHHMYEQTILRPASDRPRQANIRYLLHPVSVPGVFHAKLFLFASKERGRLVIGSANLTRPGITSNAEMVAHYDFELNKDEIFLPIFQEAFGFVVELNNRYPNSALTANLQALQRDAPWLSHHADTGALTGIRFIHNLDTPIWDQLVSYTTAPVNAVFVLSRYFDSEPGLITQLDTELSPRRIVIFTQNGITTLSPAWLRHPLAREGTVRIMMCTYGDEDHRSPLHAKAIALQTDKECVLAFGSANFTTPALFRTAEQGNIEVLIVIRAAAKHLNIETLFDPDGSSSELTDESHLQSATQQDPYQVTETYSFRLLEATLIEQTMILVIDGLDDDHHEGLCARLGFDDDSGRSLVVAKENDQYVALCSGDIVKRLGESSTVVQIEASRDDGAVVRSNPVLVTNLIDIQSGQSLRRERQIRGAEQSTEQFLVVLQELISLGDEHDLLVFLNYCDIPIAEAIRPPSVRAARPVWDGGKGMRHLGHKNLIVFVDVHDAALHFVDHHIRKLKHHVNYGSINGVSNFMHILLAIGSVIRSQLDRLLEGLEAARQPISVHDWFTYRQFIDLYCQRFESALQCLRHDYLPRVAKDYGANEVAKRLDSELAHLDELGAQVLGFHSRLESLRGSTMRVGTPSGALVTPQYFECILNEMRWPVFAESVESMLATVDNMMIVTED